eukprot:NODE_5065_length_615_cov_246.119643.p3 GENE.NODE_5065_length_615_cov_246.119643~~NODE_5065_length_615_cov_246.119643.p3  ORF type:complete len:87 (-),score=34.97 NODE_5065_length_615_cov_246.119643:306-566(-)
MVLEDLSARDRWVREVAAAFKMADADESGSVTLKEFEAHVQDQTVQAYFRRFGLNIDPDNARALFTLIDFDCDGLVTVSEFIEGCR